MLCDASAVATNALYRRGSDGKEGGRPEGGGGEGGTRTGNDRRGMDGRGEVKGSISKFDSSFKERRMIGF